MIQRHMSSIRIYCSAYASIALLNLNTSRTDVKPFIPRETKDELTLAYTIVLKTATLLSHMPLPLTSHRAGKERAVGRAASRGAMAMYDEWRSGAGEQLLEGETHGGGVAQP